MTSAETDPTRRGRQRRRLAAVLVALAAILGAAGLAVLRESRKPVIISLDPAVGEPGGVVRVVGRNFGVERGDGRLEIAGIAPTGSSYLSWSDGVIVARLPLIVDSGLVRVVNDRGRSNARFFMNRDRLPERPGAATGAGTSPRIESLSTAAAPVGGLVTIRGSNFGATRGASQVLFAWSSPVASSGDANAVVEVSEAEGGYESWSDGEIRVRVPDGASSGGLVVRGDSGSSEPLYFQVADMPGVKTYGDKRTYALSYFVQVSRVKSTGPNDLWLWIPRPVETAAQRQVRIVSRTREREDAGPPGVDLIRLRDLQPGRVETAYQAWSLQVHTVEVEVRPERIREIPAPIPELVTRWTGPDRLVDPDDTRVKALVRRLGLAERNPYRLAKAAWDLCLAEWKPAVGARAEGEDPLNLLDSGTGDPHDFAIAMTALLRALGVPALPVSGYLVSSGRTWRHYWVEFWIHGLGWIPLDPFLGAGGAVPGFAVPFSDRSRYFCGLDNRHVAFSRGAPSYAPMAPDGRVAVRERIHSLQDRYEEASGAIEEWTSFWSEVEVTGIY
ncbi:MAG: IPT/TIG domain-containing protein [Spirochaetales bacterium]|nr:IPT/TIG domain-containing protein [Spirochaetales bacterium]